jgi:hypothetical protein
MPSAIRIWPSGRRCLAGTRSYCRHAEQCVDILRVGLQYFSICLSGSAEIVRLKLLIGYG